MTTKFKPISTCELCGCQILDGDKLCIKCYKKSFIKLLVMFLLIWILTAVITAIIFDTAITFGICWFWLILFPSLAKRSKYITPRKMYKGIPVTLEELAPKLRHNPKIVEEYRMTRGYDEEYKINSKYFALYLQDEIYKKLKKNQSNILAEHPEYLTFVRGSVNNSTSSAADVFKNNVKKFLAVCNEVPNHEKISFLFVLASIIVVLPLDEKFNLPALKNKYVLTDSALLLMLYAITKFSASGSFLSDEDEEKLFSYISTGITRLYGLDDLDFSLIKENRISYFKNYLYKVYPDIDSYIREAILLFDYDVTYNRYIEFKDNSPIIVHDDFLKQMRFETQMKNYLKGTIEIIDNHLSGAYI